MFKEYLLHEWALILILGAFAAALKMTVSLNRRTIRRMYVLIGEIFLLSAIVFVEFYYTNRGMNRNLRVVLMAVRYSATPVFIAQVIHALVKTRRGYVFIPAAALAVIDIISIFTGIVFSLGNDNVLHRGPLGYLPFIVAGIYCALLVYLLYRRSNKRMLETIPILFLCFAFSAGLILPFVFGSEYSRIFCVTIAIALFTYYVFLILQLTSKDPLTGLLNRQAFYAETSSNPEDISALVSLDMNGLKAVNDTGGHAAGDEALSTLGLCFMRALKRRQSGYRIGGDEFVIVCRHTSRNEVSELIQRIRDYTGETPYSCSIGYSYNEDGKRKTEDLLRESDAMMYAEKAKYYESAGRDRRKN